jgi:ArsR family transcriptional regulator
MVHECIKEDSVVSSRDSEIAEIGQALAHPIRVAILRLLADGERCACEIEPCFDLDQSGISRHLTVLRRAGLVASRRDGVRILHRLASPSVGQVLDLAERILREQGRGDRVA